MSCPLKKSWKLRWRRARSVAGTRPSLGTVDLVEFSLALVMLESATLLPF
jgi:hypothetical protein